MSMEADEDEAWVTPATVLRIVLGDGPLALGPLIMVAKLSAGGYPECLPRRMTEAEAEQHVQRMLQIIGS